MLVTDLVVARCKKAVFYEIYPPGALPVRARFGVCSQVALQFHRRGEDRSRSRLAPPLVARRGDRNSNSAGGRLRRPMVHATTSAGYGELSLHAVCYRCRNGAQSFLVA